jgi:hypothetical protein
LLAKLQTVHGGWRKRKEYKKTDIEEQNCTTMKESSRREHRVEE